MLSKSSYLHGLRIRTSVVSVAGDLQRGRAVVELGARSLIRPAAGLTADAVDAMQICVGAVLVVGGEGHRRARLAARALAGLGMTSSRSLDQRTSINERQCLSGF